MMPNDRRSIERSLEQLRSWLQSRAQSPARDGWEDLSAQMDGALRRIEDLLAREALQEATRELSLLQRRLGVPTGIASPYWKATPISERPTVPVEADRAPGPMYSASSPSQEQPLAYLTQALRCITR